MKKYISLIIVIVLVFSTAFSASAAFLDKYYIDDDDVTLTIQGSIEGGKKGESVFVQLLDAGKTIDENAEYSAEKILSDFVVYRQIPLNSEGGYSITANMKGRAIGEYLLRVNGTDVKKIFYTSVELKEDALLAIEDACLTMDREEGINTLIALIDTENPIEGLKMYFGSDIPYRDDVDSSVLAEIIYNAVNEDDSCISTPSSFTKCFVTYLAMAALNEGLGDITDKNADYGLNEIYARIYSEQFSDSLKSGFSAKYFKDKEITTFAALNDLFETSVVLAYANSFDAWSDAEVLITATGNDIGIDMKEYNGLSSKKKSELHQTVSKYKNIVSVSSLADKINEDIKKLSKENDKSSGNGGGGGGGGGGGFSNTASTAPIVTGGDRKEKSAFTDMAGFEWAQEAVDTLCNKGIVSGIGNDMFAPGRQITREEMLAMLLRAYGVDASGAHTDRFIDVDTSAWYAPFVAKAHELGVISGTSDTTFGTGKYITREEAAVMANNISKIFGKIFTADATVFTDDAEISPWAKEAVYALKGASVINGTGDGAYAPKMICTRSQAAQIIYVLISK